MEQIFQRYPEFKLQWDRVQQDPHLLPVYFTVVTAIVERLSSHVPDLIRFNLVDQMDLWIYWTEVGLCVLILPESVALYRYTIEDEKYTVQSNKNAYILNDKVVDRVLTQLNRILKSTT